MRSLAILITPNNVIIFFALEIADISKLPKKGTLTLIMILGDIMDATGSGQGLTLLLIFQDTNLTWATEDPDFTPCFQRTVLIWTPCAFLWAFSSLEAFYLINSRNRNVPWNGLNLSKLGVVLLLSIVCLSDFGYAVNLAGREENVVFNVHYYTPFILLVSFVSST